MTLLEELLENRDYWLVPVGKRPIQVGIDRIIKVTKGANPPWMEESMAYNETKMIEALRPRTASPQ